jgi:hypothetical protein
MAEVGWEGEQVEKAPSASERGEEKVMAKGGGKKKEEELEGPWANKLISRRKDNRGPK